MDSRVGSVIQQARRGLLATILATVAVLIGIVFQDDREADRAYNDLRIVQSLVSYLNTAALSTDTNTFADMLLPGQEAVTPLAGVGTIEPAAKSIDNTGPTTSRAYHCGYELPVGTRLFIDDRGEPVNIEVSSFGPRINFFQRGLYTNGSWRFMREMPSTPTGFLKLWNKLVASPAVAIVEKVETQGAVTVLAFRPSSLAHPNVPPVSPKEGYYSPSKIENPESGSRIARTTPSPISLRIGRLSSLPGSEEFQIESVSFPPTVDANWRKNGISHVIAGSCSRIQKMNDEAPRFPNMLGEDGTTGSIVFPVRLKSLGHNWAASWMDQARSANFLTAAVENRVGSFEQAFPDLEREMVNVGNLPIMDAVSALQKNRDAPKGKVTVFGLSLEAGLVRSIGALIICAAQLWFLLYLKQAVVRMQGIDQNDPGVWEGWFVLFDDALSKTVTLGVFILPPIALFAIIIFLAQDFAAAGWEASNAAIITFVCLVAGVAMTTACIVYARRLRSATARITAETANHTNFSIFPWGKKL